MATQCNKSYFFERSTDGIDKGLFLNRVIGQKII